MSLPFRTRPSEPAVVGQEAFDESVDHERGSTGENAVNLLKDEGAGD
jgi:hypothetical protein